MAKYFKLADAERLLPQAGQLLHQAIFQKSEFQKADRELNEFQSRVRISGGARVDRSGFLAVRARRDTSAAALKQALDEIEALGALVKDLEIGLIDFLCLYEGREVCLCWKLGEDRIAFWHGLEEGFRGRKAIDEEFLRKHSTE